MEFLYFVPVAVLCLLGGAIVLLRSRKRSGLHPVVRDLLEQAMDQRSIMSVEFTATDLTGWRFFGPCVNFDEETALIDVSLHKGLAEWIGEAVLVSFRLDNKGTSSYYQFTSHLRSLPRSGGDFWMQLDTPAEIIPNQKRSFVRVAPDKEDTYGVGVWLLDPVQGYPEDPATLGAAQVSYRRDRPDHLSLLNVSAAGLCLKMKRPQEDLPLIDPQIGARLLCLLMLRSQDREQTLPFWLDCTVMNRRELEDASYNILGLHFNAWAVPSQGNDAVSWFAVGDRGAVGPLATWVLRQQLAQLGQKKSVRPM